MVDRSKDDFYTWTLEHDAMKNAGCCLTLFDPAKGAPEIVLGHCTSFRDADGSIKPLTMGKRKGKVMTAIILHSRYGAPHSHFPSQPLWGAP